MKISLSRLFTFLYFGLFLALLAIFLYWQLFTIKSFHDTEVKNFFGQTHNIVEILLKKEQDKIKEIVNTNIVKNKQNLRDTILEIHDIDIVFIEKNKKIEAINGFSLVVDVKQIAHQLISKQSKLNQIIKITIKNKNYFVIAFKNKIIDKKLGKVEGSIWGVTILNKNQLFINQLKVNSKIDNIAFVDNTKNIIASAIHLENTSDILKNNQYGIVDVTLGKKYKFTKYKLSESLDILFFIDNTKYNDTFNKYILKVSWVLIILLFLGIIGYLLIKHILIKQLILLKEFIKQKQGEKSSIYQSNLIELDEIAKVFSSIALKQKEYEYELEFEKNKLSSIIRNIPELLWIKDQQGKYLTCNKRFEEFFGATEKEIVGKTDYDFVDKDLGDFFRQHDLKAMNSDKPISNYEEITFALDGHKEYLLTTKVRVTDIDGEIFGILGIGRDITELHRSKQELETQKQELETIFNYAQDGITIIDVSGNFLNANKAFISLCGLSLEELLKHNLYELVALEDREKNKKAIEIALKQGQADNIEETFILFGEKRTIVNMSISLLPDKKSFLLIVKDITALKLLEDQSKLASMGEMIGNIAHQWRQPLSVITTSASGMNLKYQYGQELTQDEIADYTNIIIEQSEYLSKTIDNFRDFLKGDKHHEQISIKRVLEYTFNLVNATIKNNHITLIQDIEEELYINASINELSEALINIINNSKDVLKEKIINQEDRLIFVKAKAEGDKIVLEFKDSGGGIEEKIMDRIFEPYFTTKHQSVGTGLGLAMVDKIVRERHFGILKVHNDEYTYNGQPYKGACFSIILNKSQYKSHNLHNS